MSQSAETSESAAHVRGYSAYNTPASLAYETAAFSLDAACALALFFGTLKALHLPLSPRLWWLPLFFAELALVWVGQKFLAGRTLGDMAWRLRPRFEDRFRLRWKLFQFDKPDPQTIGIGIFLTTLAWSSALIVGARTYAGNPMWMRADAWKIAPFLPPLHDEWMVSPFFYSLGAWPKTFRGKPVFYSLPYEKGPPTRFLGHIVARWSNPDVSVIFEGPKTPEAGAISRESIRQCATLPLIGGRAGASVGTIDCLKIRETVLGRHIEEMERISPQSWGIRWFTVENGALAPEDRLQGIYLSAASATRQQTRFILITARGAQQAIILSTLSNPDSPDPLPEKTLEQAIGSLRISDDLGQGRDWVDQQLAGVKIESLEQAARDQDFPQKIADIHALLLAKLSVDPKTFDTYFHLAGTSLLLARTASHASQQDLLAIAKPLIQSAQAYARDVSPSDPRIAQLQAFLNEIQKY